MPLFGIAVGVLLLCAGAIVVWQNPGALPLTILGTQIPPLPLGLWVVIATLLGLAVGFLLLLLLGGKSLRASLRQQRPRSVFKARRKANASQRVGSFHRTEASDWYDRGSSDWQGEGSNTATETRRRTNRATEPEPFAPEEELGDRVVDADYRVIRPPSRPVENRVSEDDEWDDEFFDR
ncbi:MAG TPA: hypothetical protein V6D19_15690 [Stenomitos sp.]